MTMITTPLTTNANLPGATKICADRELGWGLFRSLEPAQGDFQVRFREYAIVLLRTSKIDAVRLNSKPMPAPNTSETSFTFLRPGDCISGTFNGTEHIECLLFADAHVERLLETETNVPGLKLPAMIRQTATPLPLCLWQRICRASSKSDTTCGKLAEECARFLLIALIEPLLKVPHGNIPPEAERMIRSIADHINANLEQRHTLAELSQAVGLSPCYVAKLFKQATGGPVRRFVLDRRLDAARERLELTRAPICAIAHDCGFSSQSHLTTAFKMRFGTTPRSYRTERQPAFVSSRTSGEAPLHAEHV